MRPHCRAPALAFDLTMNVPPAVASFRFLRRRARLVFGVLLAHALLTLAASAATLTGRVRDANTNAYLLGATVTIRELNRQAVTDAEGRYLFADLPEGNYTLVVDYVGYKQAPHSVALRPGTLGAMTEDLTVGDEVVSLGSFVVEGNR